MTNARETLPDPLARPLDRHLCAQRIGFGPDSYRAGPDCHGVWAITCPRCVDAGRTVTVHEAGEGGPVAFSACSAGCPVEQVRRQAGELERFWVDCQDAVLLPLRHDGLGWNVYMSLGQFSELVEEAA